MKYPKIETLYVRSNTDWKVLTDQVRFPEFELVNRWLVTEKIDGTNVRVILTPEGDVEIRGRTDKAQFNPVVLTTLQEMFSVHRVRAAIRCNSDATWPLTILYGEGYGEKIQKGGKYRKGQSFRLFDVRVGDWWLNWDDVCDIADKLQIKTVPDLCITTLLPRSIEDVVDMFELGSARGSFVAYEESCVDGIKPEGIVARTDPLLFTRRGGRLMWKLKFKDFV